jgi:Domain of unknown function (DUF6997)
MAQKDWNEVLEIFSDQASEYIADFLDSSVVFGPSDDHPNPFNANKINFSAQDLNKPKPGSWIPIYKVEELPAFFHDNKIMPIRSGPAEFFFYRGQVFFDLQNQDFDLINADLIEPVESFVPATLTAQFQRNENAYLNKAVALGYITDFLENDDLKILERNIKTKTKERFLYGQFGKIKTSQSFDFETSHGSKRIYEGFQFEIDLVLESEDEIIIFEAKSSHLPTKNFSLLQLYYPLIYFKSILKESKTIRTVFIDITAKDNTEAYRLLEVKFENDFFDQVQVLKHTE